MVKGSLGLMAQLITALTVKLLAATDELRAHPIAHADTEGGAAESAVELADTLRCCLEEMWNVVGARVKQTAAVASASGVTGGSAKGKKKNAAPSAALTVTMSNQGSA